MSAGAINGVGGTKLTRGRAVKTFATRAECYEFAARVDKALGYPKRHRSAASGATVPGETTHHALPAAVGDGTWIYPCDESVVALDAREVAGEVLDLKATEAVAAKHDSITIETVAVYEAERAKVVLPEDERR